MTSATAADKSQAKLNDVRVLIYSHDTYGLGHLRRCRTIANALVNRYKGVSVLIISGSPIIGQFEFSARVDFVRIPGVIKLYNGDYTSLALHIDISQTLEIREAIIKQTALSFKPDLFLVDKEPLGLQGEVESTLTLLKSTGAYRVLGLRDVMDEPEKLSKEWSQKGIFNKLDDLYDSHWVYGPKEMGDPLEGLDLPASINQKTRYTGFLDRTLHIPDSSENPFDEPFVLVTTGGGGDGAAVIEAVINAYNNDPTLPLHAYIVLGPFMPQAERTRFIEQAEDNPRLKVITFDNRLEGLMAQATAVIAMGGYNTFCEILTLRKRALIVPRVSPRLEQFIRASKAEKLGLVTMLHPDTLNDNQAVIAALHHLPQQAPPIIDQYPAMLDGLNVISELFKDIVTAKKDSS